MSTFLNFLHDLLPTLVGVVLGVPIALWLAHKADRLQRAGRRADNLRRLRKSVATLATALRENADALVRLSESISPDSVPLDSDVDDTAWDVTHQEIVPYLDDPELVRHLARHFSQLAPITRILALLHEQSFGVASAYGAAAVRQSTLRFHLRQRADILALEARELAAKLEAAALRQ